MIHSFPLSAYKFSITNNLLKQTKPCCETFSIVTSLYCHTNKKSENLSKDIQNDLHFCLKENPKIQKFLLNEGDSDRDWGILLKQLKRHKVQNPYAKVLQACTKLNKPHLGIGFHEYYMWKNEQKLSVVDSLFLFKMLQKNKSLIPKCEEILKNFYSNFRGLMTESLVIKLAVLEVLVEVPGLFDELVKDLRESVSQGNKPIVIKAFELNQPKIAYEFLRKSVNVINNPIMIAFTNYLIGRLKDGTFSPEMITQLTKFCEENCIMMDLNCEVELQSLVVVLNEFYPSFVWSLTESTVSNETVTCNNCNLTLLPKSITKEDWLNLKNNFFNNVLQSQYVYLSSTQKELQKFTEFLSTCKPYNLVIDGLNIYYIRKNSGSDLWHQYVNYFLEKEYSVLFIGKRHIQKWLMYTKKFLKKRHLNNLQYFFVDNVSNDDLFVLYAALHRGLNTYVFSGDLLCNHASNLSPDMKKIFKKWLLTHRYILRPGLLPLNFRSHGGFSQLTKQTDNEYVWHLPKYNAVSKSNEKDVFYCFKAISRNSKS